METLSWNFSGRFWGEGPWLLLLMPLALSRLLHLSWPLLRPPQILPINSCSLTPQPEGVSTFLKPREPQLRQPRNNDNDVFSEVVIFNLRWSIIRAGHVLIIALAAPCRIPHHSWSWKLLHWRLTQQAASPSPSFSIAVVLNPGCTLEYPGEPEKYRHLGPTASNLGGMGWRAPWDIPSSTLRWEPSEADQDSAM